MNKISMNIILSFYLMLCCLCPVYSQADYPEPAKTATRLFYIQQSNNHNTFVYDANIKDGVINSSQPINQYRIVYTQDGVKKPLSLIQKRLAYGMTVLESTPDLFKLRLVSRKGIHFYLNYGESEGARIYVTINKHKMYLDKMFIQTKKGTLGIGVKVEYVLFYGKDSITGKTIVEKLVLK